MEKQLKEFFNFLKNEKKVSDNTLQSYKRDLAQFKEYITNKGIKYNKIKENAENTTNKRQKIKRNARLNVFVKTEKSKIDTDTIFIRGSGKSLFYTDVCDTC